MGAFTVRHLSACGSGSWDRSILAASAASLEPHMGAAQRPSGQPHSGGAGVHGTESSSPDALTVGG